MRKKSIFSKLFKSNTDDDEAPLSQLVNKYDEQINAYDKKMILNIIHISEISVKEVMVPRIDVISIDKQSDISEILKIVGDKGHSRLPVCDENIDNIVGVLHSKDLLKYFAKKSEFDLSKIIRTPIFVPESKIIDELLVEMREQKAHLAIVVDEYGGTSGIIFLEDIIEKIVGNIQDEFDNEVDDIVSIGENQFLINARIPLEELNKKLELEIDEEDVETLGGLLYMLFSKIPVKNEKITYKNYIFTINTISKRQIKNVKLVILDKENQD